MLNRNTTHHNYFKSNVFLKWHYISALPSILDNVAGLFDKRRLYYTYLEVDEIIFMPDNLDND